MNFSLTQPYHFEAVIIKISGSRKKMMTEKKYNKSVEPRLVKIETKLESIDKSLTDIKVDVRDIRKEIKTDFKWLLATVFGLGALMAHGFKWF